MALIHDAATTAAARYEDVGRRVLTAIYKNKVVRPLFWWV